MMESVEESQVQRVTQRPVVIDIPASGGRAVSEVWRHAFAVGTMLAGTALVLWLVVVMNDAVQPPKAEPMQSTATFDTDNKPPPRKQHEEKPRPTRQVKTSSAAKAPLPNLATAVGGVDFDLPGIDTADVGPAHGEILGQANQTTAMTADAVDEAPKPRERVQPAYPDKARERGIEGYVTLKLKVSASGDVAVARVVDAKPRGVFESAALEAVRRWQFDPGMYQGAPVETWVNQTLRFELN